VYNLHLDVQFISFPLDKSTSYRGRLVIKTGSSPSVIRCVIYGLTPTRPLLTAEAVQQALAPPTNNIMLSSTVHYVG